MSKFIPPRILLLAALSLQGCISFADTTSNRDPMAYTNAFAANNTSSEEVATTQTAAMTMQKSNIHPYIIDFYKDMCVEANRVIAEENRERPPCIPEQVVSSVTYQDQDVAVVDDGEIWEVWGGNSGVTYYLLDLKEKRSNKTLCYFITSGVVDEVKRKGNQISITSTGRHHQGTEVIDIGNKSKRFECW